MDINEDNSRLQAKYQTPNSNEPHTIVCTLDGGSFYLYISDIIVFICLTMTNEIKAQHRNINYEVI